MSQMRQLGLALPDDLRQEVEAAADAAGRSIAAEIRERLWVSFLLQAAGHNNAEAARQSLKYRRAWEDQGKQQ